MPKLARNVPVQTLAATELDRAERLSGSRAGDPLKTPVFATILRVSAASGSLERGSSGQGGQGGQGVAASGAHRGVQVRKCRCAPRIVKNLGFCVLWKVGAQMPGREPPPASPSRSPPENLVTRVAQIVATSCQLVRASRQQTLAPQAGSLWPRFARHLAG